MALAHFDMNASPLCSTLYVIFFPRFFPFRVLDNTNFCYKVAINVKHFNLFNIRTKIHFLCVCLFRAARERGK